MAISMLSFVADKKTSAGCTVTINAVKEEGIVSPNIMGFNIVYCYEGDAAWQSGKGTAAKAVAALGARQLRYPGGTVVTNYHWEHPTGQGWSDSWSPTFDASKNAKPSEFMDIDEYLGVVKTLKTEPLVGINMGSGMKYNRVQDGVAEAVRLMKHCLEMGVKVNYYYLDNEPYQPDANFTYTAEQYADAVNTYVPAMKKVDADIKIIVNTHPNAELYTKTLIEKAGKNIDIVDVHNYWKHKNATFENWKAEGLMKHRGVLPYNHERQVFEKIFADSGYPNIKLAVLEWNIGPFGDGHVPPTETEAALMVSEQFTQYIQSGLFMATFWPLTTQSTSPSNNRALLKSKADYKPNKIYDMFVLYKDVLGQQKVSSTGSVANLINLAVKSKNGKTMWVYLINKQQDQDQLNVDVALNGFAAKSVSGTGFDTGNDSAARLAVHGVKADITASSHYKVSVPKNSFVKLTFKQ